MLLVGMDFRSIPFSVFPYFPFSVKKRKRKMVKFRFREKTEMKTEKRKITEFQRKNENGKTENNENNGN